MGPRLLTPLLSIEPERLRLIGLTVLWVGLFAFLITHHSRPHPRPREGVLGAQTQRRAARRLPTVTVPAVVGQAYVFGKVALEQAGFAWRVVGPIQGYSGDLVAAQEPAAGSRVVATGSPTVTLRLGRNARYAEAGLPDNGSPYSGTPAHVVGRDAR